MIKLYGSPDGLSPNTLKIRVALIEAGLAFELVPVDLSKGEHKTPAFLHVNPHGKIPALEDTDTGMKLAETNAIMWYVQDFTESVGVQPSPVWRAQTLQFLDMVQMHVYGPQYQLMLHTTINAPEKRSEEAAAAAKSNIDRALAVIEGALAMGDWLVPSGYGIADISVAATLTNLRAKIPAYEALGPNTTAWLDRVKARPAWQKAIDTAPGTAAA